MEVGCLKSGSLLSICTSRHHSIPRELTEICQSRQRNEMPESYTLVILGNAVYWIYLPPWRGLNCPEIAAAVHQLHKMSENKHSRWFLAIRPAVARNTRCTGEIWSSRQKKSSCQSLRTHKPRCHSNLKGTRPLESWVFSVVGAVTQLGGWGWGVVIRPSPSPVCHYSATERLSERKQQNEKKHKGFILLHQR